MSELPFHPSFEALPAEMPIFPLTGVLLLPGGRLPLNIFEPRYLAMIDTALRGSRMIGMVQPRNPDAGGPEPTIYATGCAGRISAFQETEDGRMLITLTGVARFGTHGDRLTAAGFRVAQVDFAPFRQDLDLRRDEADAAVDRDRLVTALKAYFKAEGMTANWDVIADTPDDKLITSLAMICPFGPQEKQALLECETGADRGRMITALMEMAVHARDDGSAAAN